MVSVDPNNVVRVYKSEKKTFSTSRRTKKAERTKILKPVITGTSQLYLSASFSQIHVGDSTAFDVDAAKCNIVERNSP